MHRELNPDLFGDNRTKSSHPSTNPQTQEVYMPRAYTSSPTESVPAPHIEKEMAEVKAQFQHLLEQMKKLNIVWTEFSQNNNLKFDKIHQVISKLDQNHHSFVSDNNQKMSQVNLRLNERRSLDLKIQEMLDRHNSIIKSFEVRMNNMQKLLSEKEAQLVATQAAFNEAKMEIARLKRL